MDETLWELFWTTGLPEAYALAKEAGHRMTSLSILGTGGGDGPQWGPPIADRADRRDLSPSPTNVDKRQNAP